MLDAKSCLAQEILGGDGYVVLPDLFSPQEMAEARLQILKLVAEPTARLLKAGARSRLYRLLGESNIFDQMAQHSLVVEIIEKILGDDMTLGGLSAHILDPGASQMGIHVDYPYFTMKPPYPKTPVMEIQAIWMMEDFTETNGAPLFAANTQTLGQFPDPEKFGELAHMVTGKAGSVVLSHGLCWHDTSINQSEQPRVAVLGNYNPKFIRPLENPGQRVTADFLEQASPKMKQLLGLEFQAAVFQDVQNLQAKSLK